MATLNTSFAPTAYSNLHGLDMLSAGLFVGVGGGAFNDDADPPIFAVILDLATGQTSITPTKANLSSPCLGATDVPGGEMYFISYSGVKGFDAGGTTLAGFTGSASMGYAIASQADAIYYGSGSSLEKAALDGTVLATVDAGGTVHDILLAGGYVYAASSATYGLKRYAEADLTVDSTFASGGVLGSFTRLALADGWVYATSDFADVGQAGSNGLLRFSADDGAPDPTFLPQFATSTPGDTGVCEVIALPDGNLLVAGFFSEVNGVAASGIVLISGADGALVEDVGLAVGVTVPGGDVPGAGYTVRAVIAAGSIYVAAELSVGGAAAAWGIVRIDDVYSEAPDYGTALQVDRLLLGGAERLDIATRLRDVVALQSRRRSQYEGTAARADAVVFRQRLNWTMHALLAEGVVFGERLQVEHTAIVRVLARLVLGGRAANLVDAVAQVLDAVVFAAMAEHLAKGEVADRLVLGEALDAAYSAVAALLEQVLLGDRPTPQLTMFALVRDTVQLGGRPAHEADLVAALRDSIGFMATLAFDNGEYIAWVLNTESKGLSRYTNFPFNSMAIIGGRAMGATADGLYWLDGDDDDGTPIHARLRAGLSAMGTRKLKRMPEAFIGLATDGTLLLRAIVVDEETGEKHAAIYRLKTRPSAVVRENRFKLGRGLKAVDWDFELENVDGADFDIRSIEFRPLVLDRRTRG